MKKILESFQDEYFGKHFEALSGLSPSKLNFFSKHFTMIYVQYRFMIDLVSVFIGINIGGGVIHTRIEPELIAIPIPPPPPPSSPPPLLLGPMLQI